MELSSDHKDLIGFLSDNSRIDLQRLATAACFQITAETGGSSVALKTALIKGNIVKPLLRLLSAKSLLAIKTLINLTVDCHNGVMDMIESGAVNRLIELLRTSSFEGYKLKDSEHNDPREIAKMGELKSDDNDIVNCSLMLLSNLSRLEEGAIEVLNKNEGTVIEYLLNRFLEKEVDVTVKNLALDDADDNSVEKKGSAQGIDRWQHVGTVLMNCTQTEAGRKFVMRISSNNLPRLLPCIRGNQTSVIRRRGVVGVVKNCCFEKDSCWWLLNELDLLQHLLYPLVGPEEIDLDDRIGMYPELWLEGDEKEREVDEQVKLLILESILLLCASGRINRKFMRSKQCYPILKMMDLTEESEVVSEKINECVQFLRRDEEGEDGTVDKKMSENLNLVKEVIVPTNPEDYDNVD